MEINEKREIMLKHYQNPHNKSIPSSDKYKITNTRNVSCIDDLDLYILLDSDIITDIQFMGEACAICTSSASIMTNLLIGKTKEEALKIASEFDLMINNQEYAKDLLEEANCFDEIYKQPARVTCATLPWNGIKKVLEEI